MREAGAVFCRSFRARTPVVFRTATVFICVAVLLAFSAVPSFAGSYELSEAPRTVPPSDNVTVIGDSVTLGAKLFANMKNRIADAKGVSRCNVDAKTSRRLADGVTLVKQLKKQGKLGDIVVYSLTTNGSFGYGEAKKAFAAVGKNRYAVFVTGYVKGHSYFKKSNDAVRRLASEEKRVFVADWNKFISGKKNKMLSDNYCHLTPTSGGWYVDIVKKAVREARASHVATYKSRLLKKAKLSSAGTVNIAYGSAVRAAAGYWGAYTGAQKISWNSGDTSVVSIDGDGIMTGNSTGTAVITASGDEKPVKKIQFTVNVKDGTIPATGLQVRVEKVNKWAARLVAVPSPVDATGVPVFSSTDSKTVKVNRAGVAVGRKAGKAKITVRFGGIAKTVSFTVSPAVSPRAK